MKILEKYEGVKEGCTGEIEKYEGCRFLMIR